MAKRSERRKRQREPKAEPEIKDGAIPFDPRAVASEQAEPAPEQSAPDAETAADDAAAVAVAMHLPGDMSAAHEKIRADRAAAGKEIAAAHAAAQPAADPRLLDAAAAQEADPANVDDPELAAQAAAFRATEWGRAQLELRKTAEQKQMMDAVNSPPPPETREPCVLLLPDAPERPGGAWFNAQMVQRVVAGEASLPAGWQSDGGDHSDDEQWGAPERGAPVGNMTEATGPFDWHALRNGVLFCRAEAVAAVLDTGALGGGRAGSFRIFKIRSVADFAAPVRGFVSREVDPLFHDFQNKLCRDGMEAAFVRAQERAVHPGWGTSDWAIGAGTLDATLPIEVGVLMGLNVPLFVRKLSK